MTDFERRLGLTEDQHISALDLSAHIGELVHVIYASDKIDFKRDFSGEGTFTLYQISLPNVKLIAYNKGIVSVELEPYWYLRYLFELLPAAETDDDLRMLLPFHLSMETIRKAFPDAPG